MRVKESLAREEVEDGVVSVEEGSRSIGAPESV